MPDIAIARYDAVTGWLPPVCPKHGVRADRAMERKYYTKTPEWFAVLILLGFLLRGLGALILLGTLIAALAIRKDDTFRIPACQRCSEGGSHTRVLRWITSLAAFAVLFAAVVTKSGGLFMLSILTSLLWLLAMSSLGDRFEGVTGQLDGAWLKLKGVHPGFVAAMRPNPAWNRPQYLPVPMQYPGAPAPYQYPVPSQYAPPHHYG